MGVVASVGVEGLVIVAERDRRAVTQTRKAFYRPGQAGASSSHA